MNPLPMSLPKKRVHIFVVSDSTGTTAEMVINAVLVQFKDLVPVFKKFPFIRTKEQIKAILNQAHEVKGIVIYSLVSQELRAWVRKEKRTIDIYAFDLLGPILDRIRKQWDLTPLLEPGLLRRIGEESLRLAESIDFTLKHDDGQGVVTLEKADLMILGVSRTSKTPTSLYLSCNDGLKVANVPIILDIKPPDKVFTLSKIQKIGFTISPERLAFIRQKRVKYGGMDYYLDETKIREELAYSRRIFNQIKGLEVIDVTCSSIEEVANKIIEIRQERKGRTP
ncbi:MAG: kinase/pyrophosphorylase [Nitrospirae bacterium]|nr:kinase/pyrophosphorylase [Nitrospirota bacterium]